MRLTTLLCEKLYELLYGNRLVVDSLLLKYLNQKVKYFGLHFTREPAYNEELTNRST